MKSQKIQKAKKNFQKIKKEIEPFINKKKYITPQNNKWESPSSMFTKSQTIKNGQQRGQKTGYTICQR
jgi:hypothetical protein